MLVALLVTNLAVLAIAWYAIHESRISYEDRAKIVAENLSELLAQNITSVIQRIDLGVQAIVVEMEQSTARGRTSDSVAEDFIARRYKSMAASLPELDALRFADANGIIRYGVGVKRGSNISVADRDYFVRLRADPNAGLVISKPIQGRISGQWAIAIGRRCNNPDGSFAGVAYATVLVGQLSNMFTKLALGPQAAISLRDLDLAIIATHPVVSGPTGAIGNRTVSEGFQENLRLNPDHGSYGARSGMDGVIRIFSYRRMTTYPGYVNVGLARDDYLVEWRREAYKLVLMAALFSLATVAMGLLLWKSWQQREHELAAVEASRKSLDEAQQIARLGHYSYDLRTNRWQSSDILDGIFGIDNDYPRDKQHWLELIAPDGREEMQAYLKTIIEHRLPFDREYRIIRKADGQERWLHGKGKLKLDADGTPVARVGTIQDVTESKLAVTTALRLTTRLQIMTRRHASAHESERRSLARELHDRVSSSLTAIGLSLV